MLSYHESRDPIGWLIFFPMLFSERRKEKVKSFQLSLEQNKTDILPVTWHNISNSHAQKLFLSVCVCRKFSIAGKLPESRCKEWSRALLTFPVIKAGMGCSQ